MILTDHNISNFFKPVTDICYPLASINFKYDFISRNSKKLLVTIGDSWTWGANLTQIDQMGFHNTRRPDDNYRLNKVYGNIVSEQLNFDFLNLGKNGAGNYFMLYKIEELCAIANELDYDEIHAICIFTDTGREFNSSADRSISYDTWLTDNINSAADFNKIIKFLNSQVSDKIAKLTDHTKIKFKFGTNITMIQYMT